MSCVPIVLGPSLGTWAFRREQNGAHTLVEGDRPETTTQNKIRPGQERAWGRGVARED